MQEYKQTKRRGQISLKQSKGPLKQLYSPGFSYLTIGDGDLSFSLSIIKWLQYAYPHNQNTFLKVTSYDSKQQLDNMYKHTSGNIIKQLQKYKNVSISYKVDINKLQEHQDQLKVSQDSKKHYDRIIWNFPHAGFPQEQKGEHKGPGFQWEQGFHQKHINIISNFFIKGSKYLKNTGLAIVTHKTINPFGLWNIPHIGQSNGFKLIKTLDFNIEEYPGYQNRKGAGKCCGKKFPCEDAKTYIFAFKQ